MNEEVRDCLIIGGGVAGCTAGIYAKRYSLDVAIIDSLGGGGGNTAMASLVENYPGFPGGISGVELAERVKQQALEIDVDIITATARSLTPEEGLWRVSDGADFSMLTYTVIIATGAYPRSLMVPGELDYRGKGVSYCATCDGFFYRNRTVAVIGGGNAALDEALYLSNLADKVYVVHRRDELRAEQYMQDKAFASPNIEFVWNSVVEKISGNAELDGLQLRNVKTDELSELPVDGVFVAIGHIAKTEWLEGLLEMEDGFVITDSQMQTNQPGIFACGDIRVTPLRQISTAVGDATLAAHAAYQYVARRRVAGGNAKQKTEEDEERQAV
ncbi:MAG: FAD-dependent oxidoreductase [Armatimonadia bacterium]